MYLWEIDSHLYSLFKQAKTDLESKANKYMQNFAKLEANKIQELNSGKITQEEFDEWRKNKLLYGQHWDKLIKVITDEMYGCTQTAMDYLNGKVPAIFAESFNNLVEEYSDSHVRGYSFELVDANVVNQLATRDDITLPPPVDVDKYKNQQWNAKIVNSQLLQGILQGESIPKMAERIASVTSEKDLSVAMRNARTMTTAAENSGRYSGMDKLQSAGAVFEKKWIAATDERTRETHIMLNGTTVKIDEPFVTINGDEIRFPGDWEAEGKEVWNCRCSLGYKHIGFKGKHNIKDVSSQYSNLKINAVKKLLKTSTDAYSEGLHKVLKASGTPSEVWSNYLSGNLDVVTTTKINAILGDFEISNPVNKLKDITNELANYNGYVYNGIWIDPVHPSDYAEKKSKIALKEAYFNTEIQKLEEKFANGMADTDDYQKYSQFTDYLDMLKDFEAKGKEYEKLKAEFDALQQKIESKIGNKAAQKISDSGGFAPERYSAQAKENALKFQNRNEADEYYRPLLDAMWDQLTREEKYGIWEYTRNSHPMNKPLSGYHQVWSRSGFVGVLNSDWSNEDSWRDIPSGLAEFGVNDRVSYYRAIVYTTKACEKAQLEKDAYLYRGSDKNGFAGLLEGDMLTFEQASELANGDISKLKSAIVGNVFQNHAFTSSAMSSDSGFGGGVKYNIYAPKGTKGIYAEPQSFWGNTIKKDDRLYQVGEKYSSVSGEAEILIQRGTKYRITDARKEGGDLVIDMEVFEQPDYFVHGDENTIDNGATRHTKGKK